MDWLVIGTRIPSYNTAAAAAPIRPPPLPPPRYDKHTLLCSYVSHNFLFD